MGFEYQGLNEKIIMNQEKEKKCLAQNRFLSLSQIYAFAPKNKAVKIRQSDSLHERIVCGILVN